MYYDLHMYQCHTEHIWKLNNILSVKGRVILRGGIIQLFNSDNYPDALHATADPFH